MPINIAITPVNTSITPSNATKSGVNSAEQTVSPVCGAEFTPDVKVLLIVD